MDRPSGEGRQRLTWIVVVAASIAALALTIWLTTGGGADDDRDPAAQGTGPTAAASATASRSVTPSGTGTRTEGSARPSSSPSPSSASPREGGPTGRQPVAPPVMSKLPAPVRASFSARPVVRDLVVTVPRTEGVQGKARGVGELSGPAVRFTVSVSNTSDAAKNLDLVVVNAYYGSDDKPASSLSGPGAKALPARLPGGATAEGRYVFAIPAAERGRVRLDFSYDVRAPRVVFVGPVS